MTNRTLIHHPFTTYPYTRFHNALTILNHPSPLSITTNLIPPKSKPLILYHFTSPPNPYNQIPPLLPTISQPLLTFQLPQLEQHPILHPQLYHQLPPRLQYSLTSLPNTLNPIIFPIPQSPQFYPTETPPKQKT
ncbi:winged helix-turn-helix transcriptional regulator, partial [Bacillus altitudinis]|uniref:winged helix-turn-helix transcriptional regulator n=1 Tax=Bacillus altitudinis TaxID=293387 RepID=UPI00307DEB78